MTEQWVKKLMVERRWVAIEASTSKAGPSKVTPKKVKQGPGIVIPKKCCECCVGQEVLCQWDLDGCTGTCRLCRQLKTPCIIPKKWKVAHEEGHGKSSGLDWRGWR